MSDTQLWQGLERRLQEQIDRFPGVAGICVGDLGAQRTLATNGDVIFPTASTIKIHVLVQLLCRAERGEIRLDEMVRLSTDTLVGGSGVLVHLDGAQEGKLALSLLDLANLMIILSDNTATNICIDRAGGFDAVNGLLRELDLPQTKLRRKMVAQAAAAANAENVSTPQELVQLLTLLHADQPSPPVAQQTLAILKKPKRAVLNQAIPPEIPVANKPGGIPRVRCDAGLVYLPQRPYAIAVMSAFGLCPPPEQEQRLVHMAQTVHETMVALASSNRFGHGVGEYPA